METPAGNAPADWFHVLRATEGGPVTYRKTAYWGATFHVQACVGG